jgi:D-sedoheptulose 7-phosphate isomerase
VRERIRESVSAQGALLEGDVPAAVSAAARLIVDSYRGGGKLLVFGNGGSAAQAQHMVGELAGRYLLERRSLPAVALMDNPATLTAVANDYAFDQVFTRQLEGLAAPGDVALAISTSGRSANVVAGVRAARDAGLGTVALTGGDGGELRELAGVCIRVPSAEVPRIQEGHMLVTHILCEIVERELAAPGG